MKHWLAALVLLIAPVPLLATTAADLSSRIRIDGNLSDYAADEWILTADSRRPERPGDTRWGAFDDVRRVALTWDRDYLYVAFDCATARAGLMAWLENTPGGLGRLDGAGPFRRAIVLEALAPNVVVWADPAGVVDVAQVSEGRALRLVGEERVRRACLRDAQGVGGLELALPWADVEPRGGVLRLLAAITGGVGTGSGDAAPDPSVSLSSEPTATATLDQCLLVTVDADGDGRADEGVSPAGATRVDPGEVGAVRARADLDLRVSPKAFAPDRAEETAFELIGGDEEVCVFLTCAVYSIGGSLVRTLYEDDARVIRTGVNPTDPLDRWGGRDRGGAVVDGGVYVVNLLWGQARGSVDGAARATVVVVR